MLLLPAYFCVLLSIQQTKALTILHQMSDALARVERIEVEVDQVPQTGSKPASHALVKAAINPIRYWSRLDAGSDHGVEYAAWDGQEMIYTDDDGKRSTIKPPSFKVAMNGASSFGYYSWEVFFDRDRLKAATADNCFFVQTEEVEGKTCDLVGLIKTVTDHERESSIRYYWVDRHTHLPVVFQVHGIIRGRSTLSDKLVFKNARIDPIWKDNPFTGIPAQVPGVSPVKDKPAGAAPAMKPGDSCPEADVQDVELKSRPLKSLLSGTTLVSFWAPWCGPCLNELEALQGMPEVKDGRIKVIAVGCQDSKENIRTYIKAAKNAINFVIDPECEARVSKLTAAYGIFAIPHAFLYGPDGKLIREWTGFGDAAELRKQLGLH